MMIYKSFDTIFARLGSSKFRTSFHLNQAMCAYAAQKGLLTIQQHAEDFIRTRLAPAQIPNDGKQTPMKGHPVFIAQHATATCCRGCLEKWYGVAKNSDLSLREQASIVAVILAWIEQEIGLKLSEFEV